MGRHHRPPSRTTVAVIALGAATGITCGVAGIADAVAPDAAAVGVPAPTWPADRATGHRPPRTYAAAILTLGALTETAATTTAVPPQTTASRAPAVAYAGITATATATSPHAPATTPATSSTPQTSTSPPAETTTAPATTTAQPTDTTSPTPTELPLPTDITAVPTPTAAEEVTP